MNRRSFLSNLALGVAVLQLAMGLKPRPIVPVEDEEMVEEYAGPMREITCTEKYFIATWPCADPWMLFS